MVDRCCSTSVAHCEVHVEIETTLTLPALHHSDEGRYWSALSASWIKSLNLPKAEDRQVLAADGDAVGLVATKELSQRAAGLRWHVTLMQALEGKNWINILMKQRNG